MSDVKKPRRPSGGYARGEETRLRIIKAAIECFGESGFEGASTRDIAQRAGVNAPALLYYFANKEGLYQTCAEYIADEALAFFSSALDHARTVLNGEPTHAALIDAFLRIQGAIADKILMAPQNIDTRMFFARQQAGYEPGIASEIIQQRLKDPMNDVCAQLVSRISGLAEDDPLTIVRMLSLNGQVLVFHMTRHRALSYAGQKDTVAPDAALIKATVQKQTRMLLEAWSNKGLPES